MYSGFTEVDEKPNIILVLMDDLEWIRFGPDHRKFRFSPARTGNTTEKIYASD
jgi:hypothetical protein